MESYSICLFVTYFIEHNVFKVHPGCSLYQNFLLFFKKKVSMAVPDGSCGIKEILVEARGSLVLQTLSCSIWDLVPWLGIKPRPHCLGAWSLGHWATRILAVPESPSFLRLSNIPVYRWTTFCLSFHLSIDTWVASSSWLLWIILLRTWVLHSIFKAHMPVLA